MSKLTDEQNRELQRLAELPDEEIDTSEIPEIRDFSSAIRGKFYRPIKKQVTLQIDADLIAWFKAQAGGYQTRINSALREYVEEHERRGGKKKDLTP